MKYLNDRITFTISGISGKAAGTYRYDVYRDNTVMFRGNFYYNGTDSSYTFDISDIVRTDGWSPDVDVLKNIRTETLIPNRLQNKYKIRVYWTSSTTTDSSSEDVNKVWYKPNTSAEYYTFMENTQTHKYDTNLLQETRYLQPDYRGFSAFVAKMYASTYTYIFRRYPDGDTEGRYAWKMVADSLDKNINQISDWDSYEQYTIYTEQPYAYVGEELRIEEYFYYRMDVTEYYPDVPTTTAHPAYKFISHYPYDDEKYCPFLITFWHGTDSDEGVLKFCYPSQEYGFTDYDIPSSPTYTYANTVSGIIDSVPYVATDKNPTVKYYNKGWNTWIVCAEFDICPKPFYLIWQDRYGNFISQGFSGKYVYSEKFERGEVQNYKNQRRYATIQVKPKWKVNSEWIKEEMYPYYEAIFTSPVLMLFDYNLNKTYSVVVSGDYTEKTFRTEKKMLQMNLDLELNEYQNIIY